MTDGQGGDLEKGQMLNPNSWGIFARNHGQILPNPSTFSKKVPQLLDFNGFGTVASVAWLNTQSWIQQKQPVEFDGPGVVRIKGDHKALLNIASLHTGV